MEISKEEAAKVFGLAVWLIKQLKESFRNDAAHYYARFAIDVFVYVCIWAYTSKRVIEEESTSLSDTLQTPIAVPGKAAGNLCGSSRFGESIKRLRANSKSSRFN